MTDTKNPSGDNASPDARKKRFVEIVEGADVADRDLDAATLEGLHRQGQGQDPAPEV